MAEVLQVDLREEHGKRRTRRLRSSGVTPAILYGHGKPCVSLRANAAEISAALRHGTQLVELQGGANETALIREVQWDAFGQEILHFDLIRVSADEMIEATVAIELRGEAPGVNQGGIVELLHHDISIRCPATSLPEKLELNINSLDVGQTLTAAELNLPDGAELVTPSDEVLAQCVEPKADLEEEATDIVADGIEPEVIARKEGDEDDDSAS